MGAIGLDSDAFACLLLQCCDKSFIDKQRGFSPCENHHGGGGVFVNLLYDILKRHHLSLLVLGITEDATEVASAETDKDGRGASVIALALEGIEYFVYSKHCGASSLM